MQIDDLLRLMAREEASDLHLKTMRPPMLRVRGKLLPLEMDPVQPAVLREMLARVLSERQREILEKELYLDFGYSVAGVSRFRGTVYHQRGTLGAVFRRVPFLFPTLDEWGLPEVLREFGTLSQGLVLVVGPAGAGKSSTLAALMREIVDTRLVHVVTIEDPIEFLFTDNLGSVSQREVGTDTRSFSDALKNTLRQDPDVIMVGEMRDTETMATVLTAAETGHLVFSTLHSNGAAQTLDRIIDAFPESHHRQIRLQLSSVLQGVVSLQLVERADGTGMVAAVEILRRNPRVVKLVLEGKTAELHEEIERSVSFERMQTLNQSLIALVLNGVVTRQDAHATSPSPGEFIMELRQFLRPGEAPTEGDPMADSTADFSKILELREMRKLHEESQERFRQELADREATIQLLREEIEGRQNPPDAAMELHQLREDKEKLAQQLTFQRQESEAKIARLQNRIKELSAATAHEPAGSGIFRR